MVCTSTRVRAAVPIHVLDQHFDRAFVRHSLVVLGVRMSKRIPLWIIGPDVHVGVDDRPVGSRRCGTVAIAQCKRRGQYADRHAPGRRRFKNIAAVCRSAGRDALIAESLTMSRRSPPNFTP